MTSHGAQKVIQMTETLLLIVSLDLNILFNKFGFLIL